MHPDDAAIVAVATSTGAYLSRDSAGRFTALAESGEGLGVFFDLDGRHLWHASFDGQPRLARIPLGGGDATQIELPPLSEDAVAYIAQNPAARTQYAVATFGRGVFVSRDAGRSWSQIAERGKAK